MTLALIPARGGSKGIPRKNIREIAGKPLIAWTIEAALAARGISRVVVSTDDDEIAAVASEWGADVPFMRPASLATDEASGIAPALHALNELPGYQSLLLLQPTSPLRGACHIEGLLRFATARQALSVVSVCEVSERPEWMYRIASDDSLTPYTQQSATRRQELAPLYVLNGAMYWARTEWLLSERDFVGEETLGYSMPVDASADIDTMDDWTVAELLLGRGGDT